jgi:hypothetical protein
MDPIILVVASNIGLILITLTVYLRYSHFRISSANKIKELQNKFDESNKKNSELEVSRNKESQANIEKIQQLMNEISDLRKSYESSINIRHEFEKQLGVVNAKIEEKEQEIKVILQTQENIISSNKDAVAKMGQELFRRINEVNRQEIETSRNLMGKAIKVIGDYMEKINSNLLTNQRKNSDTEQSIKSSKNQHQNLILQQKTNSPEHHFHSIQHPLTQDLVETIEASGYLANQNFFTPLTLNKDKALKMLCEVAFLKEGTLYSLDLKACQIFDNYNQQQSSEKINLHLVAKFDKYLQHINNDSYKNSIKEAIAGINIKFNNFNKIVAVAKTEDLKILKNNKIYEKFINKDIKILTIDEINNLII